MADDFRNDILRSKVPEMETTRFLCGVVLKDVVVSKVQFKNFSAELAGPYQDYFLNVIILIF